MNYKEIKTKYHKVKYVGPGVSVVGLCGECLILTDEEIDQIHGLKEANRR